MADHGSQCIQCGRTADELPPPGILLTRPRPLFKDSEYQICLECARLVRDEQAAMARGDLKSTLPGNQDHAPRMARQPNTVSSARADRKTLAGQARREQADSLSLFDDEEDAA